ncbi:MAG: hypothetical protein HZB92_04150 [Euryarchaeota archaeon]|nr:hypothetical protein [Euryarchaeota archaeon]
MFEIIGEFFYPIVTFLACLVAVLVWYLIAGKLGPAYKEAKYKLTPYACGEDYKGGKAHHSYNFFHVAFFFTVLHVGALLIATAPSGEGALLGVALIGSMAITAVALYTGGGKDA